MKISTLLLMLFFLLPFDAKSQWESLSGPNQIYSIYANDSLILAGSYIMGMNLTTDNGTSWIHEELQMDANTVYDIVNFNDTLYAGTDKGLYYSADSGFSWQFIMYDAQTYSITKIITHKNKILIGTNDGRVYSSKDYKNWELSSSEFISPVWEMYSDSERIYAANGDNTLYISTDDAKSWKSISSGFTNSNIYDILVVNNNIYVATAQDGIFLSTDRGRSWELFSGNMGEYEINAIGRINNMILAATPSGIYYTVNNGTSWISLKEGMANTIVQIIFINEDYLYAGTKYTGLWRYPMETLLNPALKAPELLKPAPGQKRFITKNYFEWEAVAGATFYRLEVATDSLFEDPEYKFEHVLEQYYTIDSLPMENKYYWRVSAINANNTVFTSEPSYFFVYDEALTSPVDAISPVEIKTYQRMPQFRWHESKRAIAYNLRIYRKADDTLVQAQYYLNTGFTDKDGIVSRTIDSTLLPAQTYYWIVESISNDNRLIVSDTFKFYTATYLDVPVENHEVYFSVYPNPAEDLIYLKFNNFELPAQVRIYDLSGALVLDYKAFNIIEAIELKNVTKGMYKLIISNKRKHFQEKILIK